MLKAGFYTLLMFSSYYMLFFSKITLRRLITFTTNEFKIENTIILAYVILMWIKLRVLYYVNNWVYTTNHKRIAVNYYWFVIFSGICGMILATIIRLEMAYPGVGVLAGDSLQYLSVVTAHAVIMVFFMIMPLLFGAFGNFLLPTQLGVHDVAFPRLNSAAFWFLPAGLLMLVQLVCLDRRYQRMNCYNIREIQTLLKSQYSPNARDEGTVNRLLSETIIGLRYKLMSLTSVDSTMLNYYRHSLHSSSLTHILLTSPLTFTKYLNETHLSPSWTSFEYMIVKNFCSAKSYYFYGYSSGHTLTPSSLLLSENSSFKSSEVFNVHQTFFSANAFFTNLSYIMVKPFNQYSEFTTYLSIIVGEIITPLIYAIRVLGSTWALMLTSSLWMFVYTLFTPFTVLWKIAYSMLLNISLAPLPVWNVNIFPYRTYTFYFELLSWNRGDYSPYSNRESNLKTFGSSLTIDSISSDAYYAPQEAHSSWRFARSVNPVFRYDFKVGNYIPDDTKKLNPHLLTTIKDVTMGLRKPSWFYSSEYRQLLQGLFATHLLYFAQPLTNDKLRDQFSVFAAESNSLFTSNAHSSAMLNPTSSFYNVFLLLQSSPYLLHTRLLAANTLDQKFNRMFATASLQQRIFANWRQLKFTREAWRCKLLAARHQNTLYKRYLNEDSVVWAVERNAKDVLPGWAMITPFSARSRFTAIGKVDIGLLGVFLVLNSSIVTSANFLVTYRYLSTLNNRKMRDARSFFTEGVMVASWMMIAANPMLAIGILMLLSDRHWQTSFFDYSGGGDTVLFQHMFWFFGHPEVYVIMIPGFGFNNTILSFYLRKRVSARASLLYSMYTIAFLGFFVWGHHMYMVGLAHTTRMLFSTLTVMISVPAATKLMHWCVTLVNSTFVIELPMCFQLLFIFFRFGRNQWYGCSTHWNGYLVSWHILCGGAFPCHVSGECYVCLLWSILFLLSSYFWNKIQSYLWIFTLCILFDRSINDGSSDAMTRLRCNATPCARLSLRFRRLTCSRISGTHVKYCGNDGIFHNDFWQHASSKSSYSKFVWSYTIQHAIKLLYLRRCTYLIYTA